MPACSASGRGESSETDAEAGSVSDDGPSSVTQAATTSEPNGSSSGAFGTTGTGEPLPSGALVVAAGTAVYVSADGTAEAWVEREIPSNFFLASDVATDGSGRWVIADDIARVLFSDDGTTWTDSVTPYPVAKGNDIIYDLADVEYCDGRWVIVGGTFVSFDDGVTLYSDDGETFELASGATEDERTAVTCDPDTGVWISVTSTNALRSDDGGATWSIQGAVPISTSGIAIADGVWISVGGLSSGRIGRTTDVSLGVDWQEVDPPETEELLAVATDGMMTFVATGASGAILQSSDAGLTWQDTSVATEESLGVVAWLPASERFAVGDTGGNIRFSVDGGESWSAPVATGSDRPVGGIASVP